MKIGELCRAMTISDVASLMNLDWHAVKDLDKLYMREQLRRAGHPAPRVIGIDVDLSRFCSASLMTYCATKEKQHGTQPIRRIPQGCGGNPPVFNGAHL